MIVAREKTGYYGLPAEAPRPKYRRKRYPALRGQKLVFTGLVIAGFLLSALVIYYYSLIFSLGYQINRLEKQLADLRVENSSLDAEICKLTSLDRIEALAVNKLGMVKPDSTNILLVTVDGNDGGTEAKAAQPGEPLPPAQQKNRVIQAFAELVNRLEKYKWLGSRQGAGLEEGLNANYQHSDPEKNQRTLSGGNGSVFLLNLAPGLAAACYGRPAEGRGPGGEDARRAG